MYLAQQMTALIVCARLQRHGRKRSIISSLRASISTSPKISKGHFAEVAPDIRIHYAECSPPDGEDIKGICILLHGFPDYHGSWRAQMPAIAEAGYKAVAPDLRGYGLSSKPSGVEHYGKKEVTSDIVSLAKLLSPDQRISMLVGHDWGAFAAWAAAADHPDVFERLAILNVPHPVCFSRGLKTLQQLQKSWYIFAFQTPLLPELFLEFANFALLRNLLQTDPDVSLPSSVVDCHVASFASNPGSMGAAVNYYRAAARGLWGGSTGILGISQSALRAITGTSMSDSGSAAHPTISIPVQVVWGTRDRYLGVELAEPPEEFVPNKRPTRFLDATHWVHWDCPQEVNEELLRFFRT